MSLFRHLATWGLRAIALWGAFELSASLYASANEQAHLFSRLAGHRAAMARLETRAATLEGESAASATQLSALQRRADFNIAANDAIGATIARQLREELMALGAQGPVVEATHAEIAPELYRLRITASWREAQTQSPVILYTLSQRYRGATLAALRLERLEGVGLVETEIEFDSLARAAPERP